MNGEEGEGTLHVTYESCLCISPLSRSEPMNLYELNDAIFYSLYNRYIIKELVYSCPLPSDFF